jgi:hypothetical protein
MMMTNMTIVPLQRTTVTWMRKRVTSSTSHQRLANKGDTTALFLPIAPSPICLPLPPQCICTHAGPVGDVDDLGHGGALAQRKLGDHGADGLHPRLMITTSDTTRGQQDYPRTSALLS